MIAAIDDPNWFPPPDEIDDEPAPPPSATRPANDTKTAAQSLDDLCPAVARLDTRAIFLPVPPVDWICEPIELAAGAPTMLAGLGFAGKTPLAQDLALAVASGGRVWEAFDCRRGRVLHLDYEQGQRLTNERYQRLARSRGTDVDELIAGNWLRYVAFPSLYIDGDDTEAWLTEETAGVSLAIVDSFRAAAPHVNENESSARVPLDLLGRVSGKTGCAFLVIHHAKKPAADDDGTHDRHSMRGSGALFDACQAVLIATPALDERTKLVDGEEQLVRDAQPPKLSIQKARISGRTYAQPMTFAIDDVEIDGDPRAGLSVCVSAPVAKQPLRERLVTALRAAKTPPTRNDLKTKLACSGTALDAAIDVLGKEVEEVPIVVRGKATVGLILRAKGKP